MGRIRAPARCCGQPLNSKLALTRLAAQNIKLKIFSPDSCLFLALCTLSSSFLSVISRGPLHNASFHLSLPGLQSFTGPCLSASSIRRPLVELVMCPLPLSSFAFKRIPCPSSPLQSCTRRARPQARDRAVVAVPSVAGELETQERGAVYGIESWAMFLIGCSAAQRRCPAKQISDSRTARRNLRKRASRRTWVARASLRRVKQGVRIAASAAAETRGRCRDAALGCAHVGWLAGALRPASLLLLRRHHLAANAAMPGTLSVLSVDILVQIAASAVLSPFDLARLERVSSSTFSTGLHSSGARMPCSACPG